MLFINKIISIANKQKINRQSRVLPSKLLIVLQPGDVAAKKKKLPFTMEGQLLVIWSIEII
ncbi:hypothetical protein D3P07_05055 [Paenibacillus sp. 1011MAR3C5]|nr:hypothetical protein D3P07_05055 [Paenibacillus sp. 1011MAR3C5]